MGARGVRARVGAIFVLLPLAAAWFCAQPLASAEVITGGNYRISFNGSMTPAKLPRVGSQPISVSVSGAVQPLPGAPSPALREFAIAINRHARLSLRGLPTCSRQQVTGASTSQARNRCRDALVGSGRFTAHIDAPEQAPFPAAGRLSVFNSHYRGHRALLGHVYGSEPVPTAIDVYFRLRQEQKGPFGLTLTATLPEVGEEWGYVKSFEVSLGRRYFSHGHERSLLAAGCPAPAGIFSAPFKLARGVFNLTDGTTRSRVLTGVCHVAKD